MFMFVAIRQDYFIIVVFSFFPIQLSFTIVSAQMEVWTNSWEIPSCNMTVFVGGQQPDQTMQLPSNVLTGHFSILSN